MHTYALCKVAKQIKWKKFLKYGMEDGKSGMCKPVDKNCATHQQYF